MGMSMMVAGLRPSELLAVLKIISPVLNPFSLLLNATSIVESPLVSRDMAKLILGAMIIHSLLTVQAFIILILKLLHKKNGERRKIWLWRKHYIFNGQNYAHYEPNGNLLIEICQFIGCTCLVTFDVVIWQLAENSKISYSSFGTGVFWLIICYIPGIFGFWFSSWSALYLVLACPKLPYLNSSTRKAFIWSPLAMNFFCVGIPILLVILFGVLGISLFIQLEGLLKTYSSLKSNLIQLSSRWKPNEDLDAMTTQLFEEPLNVLIRQSNHLITIYQRLAFSWACVSILMLIFYCVATISLWKFLKETCMIASGKKSIVARWGPFVIHQESNQPTRASLQSSKADGQLSFEGERPKKEPNHVLAYQLRKNYYSVCVSGALMAISLAVNTGYGVMLGKGMGEGIQRTVSSQFVMFALSSGSSFLNSLALFAQSIFFIFW